jgi:toxin-antitoxin system, toxin component, hipA family
LEEKVVLRLIANMNKALPKWKTLIQTSFLTEELKQEYENTIESRLKRLQK